MLVQRRGAGFDMHVILLRCILLVSILVHCESRHCTNDPHRTELRIVTLASVVPY